MARRAICVALLLAGLPAAGCGTAANLARPGPDRGGKVPFGGVRQDLACIRRATDADAGPRRHPGPDDEHYPQVVLAALCAVDLPLSLVGDIVTWPYTASYTFINAPVPTPPVLAEPPAAPPPQPAK